MNEMISTDSDYYEVIALKRIHKYFDEQDRIKTMTTEKTVKKSFPLKTRVRFIGLPKDCALYNKTGVVLGTAIVDVTDTYIVMLDEPLPSHLAMIITEACLELV